MKPHLTCLALAAILALSGCAGNGSKGTGSQPDDDETTSAPGTGGTETSGTGTTTTTSAVPRVAKLAASVRNGTAPLAVTFQVNAEGSGLSRWSLDFGDGSKQDGTKFPGTVLHNYTAAGTFEAKVTVHYTTGNPVADSLSIAVLPSGVKERGYKLNTTTTVTASLGFTGGGCGVQAEADPAACGGQQAKVQHDQNAATNGTWFRWYDIPVEAGAKGLDVSAGNHETQTCGGPACVPDYDIGIFDPAGTYTSVGTASNFEVFAQASPAAGTWSVVVLYFAGPPNSSMEFNAAVLY